ncbi:MAG TPA: phenylacetate--CoA ligase family protein [Thermoplasmata archaeon]|nr:phenylacetate--CoA ligase family protein [Thermoplasmata archaeon]
MNPFLNPSIAFIAVKSYLIDPGRIHRLKPEQLKRYQDKAFKRIIKYAYNVPLYHEKYKKASIHPNDIKGIKDIVKLPFVTKNDLRSHYPDGIIPISYNKEKKFVVSTGGTTGKSVFLYTDLITMIQSIIPSIREMRFFNLDIRKTRYVHIGSLSANRIDLVMEKNFLSKIRPFFSLNNLLNMDVNKPIKEIMKTLEDFKPDLIMTYPAIHQHLAFLKRKGYGENVKPKLLITGGAILDDYTRSYVEDAFGCRLLNVYPSVEAGSNIAFECMEGTWHVHSDFFYVEAIDENDELLQPGERGHIVITRLWGEGTPIIRYTGMDDWVRLSPYEECSCRLKTPVIEGGVEGRIRTNIVLPNGKVFPPGAFCFIEPVLNKHGTFKVKQYQVVQKKMNEIEILLVIDEDLRDVGASVDEIAKDIKDVYQKKTGPDVTITVKEVDKIPHVKDTGKPPPIVVSHVSTDEGYKMLDQ